MASPINLPSALSLLDLPTIAAPSTVETLLEELTPLNPTPAALGYKADPANLPAVTDFLAHTTLAHRLLAHRRAASEPPPASDDVSLARSLSHMLQTLDQTAGPVPGNCAAVCGVIRGIAAGVEKRMREKDDDSVYGGVLVDRQELEGKEEVCKKLLERMGEEQRVRTEMVRHRFQVCRDAFGVEEGVGEVESGGVDMFQVLGVREWILRWERMEGIGGVRGVIMGEVPDRGGRIGERGMPGFKAREKGSGGGRGGRRGRKKRGR